MLTNETSYDTVEGSCRSLFDRDNVQFGRCLAMFWKNIKLSTLNMETEFSPETFVPN